MSSVADLQHVIVPFIEGLPSLVSVDLTFLRTDQVASTFLQGVFSILHTLHGVVCYLKGNRTHASTTFPLAKEQCWLDLVEYMHDCTMRRL